MKFAPLMPLIVFSGIALAHPPKEAITIMASFTESQVSPGCNPVLHADFVEELGGQPYEACTNIDGADVEYSGGVTRGELYSGKKYWVTGNYAYGMFHVKSIAPATDWK